MAKKKASELFPGAVPLSAERVARLRDLVGPDGYNRARTSPMADEPSAWDVIDLARGELVLLEERRPGAQNAHPQSLVLFTTDGREMMIEQGGGVGSNLIVMARVGSARTAP